MVGRAPPPDLTPGQGGCPEIGGTSEIFICSMLKDIQDLDQGSLDPCLDCLKLDLEILLKESKSKSKSKWLFST
eukprot:983384-Prorocentrum_minimum.AAC.1